MGAMATGAVSMGRCGSGSGNARPTPASQPSQRRQRTGQQGTPAAVTAATANPPLAQRAPAGRPARAPPEAPLPPGQAAPARCRSRRRHRRCRRRVGCGESRRPGRHRRRRRSTSSVQGLSGRTTDRAGFNRPISRRAPVAAINTEYKEPSYGNWRVPRSAGLGNLGAIGTGIVMAGSVGRASSPSRFLACSRALLSWPSPGPRVLLLTVKDKHGQSVVDRFGTRMSFRLSRSSGTNLYRSGPLGVTRVGHVPAARPGREVHAVRVHRLLQAPVRAAACPRHEPLHRDLLHRTRRCVPGGPGTGRRVGGELGRLARRPRG